MAGKNVQVYPRVCGGTVQNSAQRLDVQGLSPRVRGNPGPWHNPGIRLRSIPACAGEPCAPSSGTMPNWVYPRVCGGTFPRPRRVLTHGGLSPRVRGNLPSALAITLSIRSIPACAGEPYIMEL